MQSSPLSVKFHLQRVFLFLKNIVNFHANYTENVIKSMEFFLQFSLFSHAMEFHLRMMTNRIVYAHLNFGALSIHTLTVWLIWVIELGILVREKDCAWSIYRNREKSQINSTLSSHSRFLFFVASNLKAMLEIDVKEFHTLNIDFVWWLFAKYVMEKIEFKGRTFRKTLVSCYQKKLIAIFTKIPKHLKCFLIPGNWNRQSLNRHSQKLNYSKSQNYTF